MSQRPIEQALWFSLASTIQKLEHYKELGKLTLEDELLLKSALVHLEKLKDRIPLYQKIPPLLSQVKPNHQQP